MKSLSEYEEVKTTDDWYQVYRIEPDLYVISEPHHFEQTLSSLLLGKESALLIDTSCGLGNLRKTVGEITDLPVKVVNTHTHTDHIGCNHQFDDIAMFNHPLCHQVSQNGVSHQIMQQEILEDNLLSKPLPDHIDPATHSLPPFRVNQWLTNGDIIRTADRELLVIYTPGEAKDHICLLDRENRILFSGDILLHGPVWTHLQGGSLSELITSYRKLMRFRDDFDLLIPSHSEPVADKDLLPDSLSAAENILNGYDRFKERIDPWNRWIREYDFGRFRILTAPAFMDQL